MPVSPDNLSQLGADVGSARPFALKSRDRTAAYCLLGILQRGNCIVQAFLARAQGEAHLPSSGARRHSVGLVETRNDFMHSDRRGNHGRQCCERPERCLHKRLDFLPTGPGCVLSDGFSQLDQQMLPLGLVLDIAGLTQAPGGEGEVERQAGAAVEPQVFDHIVDRRALIVQHGSQEQKHFLPFRHLPVRLEDVTGEPGKVRLTGVELGQASAGGEVLHEGAMDKAEHPFPNSG